MPGPTRPSRPYRFSHAVSHNQLLALGMIAVEGAELESAIEWAIWGFLGLSVETGRLFTTRSNFETKVKTFIRVAQKVLTDKTQRDKAALLAARIRDSSGRRNDAIHALWPDKLQDAARYAQIGRMSDKGPKMSSIDARVETLKQIAIDLRTDFLDLVAFLKTTGFVSPIVEADFREDNPA